MRTLLHDGFDFARLLAQPELVSASSEEGLEELSHVSPGWSFETLGPVVPKEIDGMLVLVLRKSRARRRWAAFRR